MNQTQQTALLTIALTAAFADGNNDSKEREHIRQLATTLNHSSDINLMALYQQVLLKTVDLTQVCSCLTEPEQRQFAYEIAISVCDADGHTTAAEQHFLATLAHLLQLSEKAITPIQQQAEQMADTLEHAIPASAPAEPLAPCNPSTKDAEIDRTILNYAILNGALELLPQSWASMAIVPLQIKMVWGIGQSHGYSLDQGHIRELLATLGIGLTSQYLEQFGRKLLGGLLGKVAGKSGNKIGQAATGIAFSFASTYALGQLAKRYYADGRVMGSETLKQTFAQLLTPAKAMQNQYLLQIQQKAQNLDMAQIMSLVRGGQ